MRKWMTRTEAKSSLSGSRGFALLLLESRCSLGVRVWKERVRADGERRGKGQRREGKVSE